MAFSGRLGAALGPAPHLSAIRQVLQEAAALGFEPKPLYQQAVQARPSDWPSVPPYEEVTETDDVAARPTKHRCAVTQDQATSIATEHLRRTSDLVDAKVRKVVAWSELSRRLPPRRCSSRVHCDFSARSTQEDVNEGVLLAKQLSLLVRLAGVEPATLGLEVLAPRALVVVVSYRVNDEWWPPTGCALSPEVARGCGGE